jgi:serine/threonine protein phosphatase PrpC
VVKAFAASSSKGGKRKNEDRVQIILKVKKPAIKQALNWPTMQLFAIYDGHAGENCAEFLKEHLLNDIMLRPEFPE